MDFDIHWETPEHTRKKKSSDWYWILGILAIFGAIASLIFGNILFSILIIFASFTIAITINRDPTIINVGLNKKGITVDKLFYPYKNISSFGLENNTLVFHTKTFSPAKSVPIAEIDEDKIRDYLLAYIPEHDESDKSLIEVIVNRLGF